MSFKLVGNGKTATIAIFLFILLVVILSWRALAHGAEIDLETGASFGPGGTGPVVGMNLLQPIGNEVSVFAGTLLWGATPKVGTNWDWHAGFRTCRSSLCASLGAGYVQDIDVVNGAHTNFFLGVSYLIGWHRVGEIDFAHLSDAGTTPVNLGRNALLVGWRLQ
ncbi:MAG: hypothetical protein ACRDK7_05020 [Solirubrobacteraceae bacterium]